MSDTDNPSMNTLRAALTDADKLRVLALWFDMWDRPETDRQAILDDLRNPGRNEVQTDLRRIADALAAADTARPLANPLRAARCVFCARSIRWVVDRLSPDGRWLDDDGISVAPDDHRHSPSSCLGCGQVGTRGIWHEPTGIYLCAERCVPALAAADTARPGHPEPCERCGRGNITWHAPSPLWNAVMRDPATGHDRYGIVCPFCFVELAEAMGFTLPWHLGPHTDVSGLWADADGRVWDSGQCLWVAADTARPRLDEFADRVWEAAGTLNTVAEPLPGQADTFNTAINALLRVANDLRLTEARP